MNNATIDTTKLKQDQNNLSAEELRKIALQSQSDEDDYEIGEQPLVSQEQLLTSDRQKQSSRKWRYLTVAIIASGAAFAFFLTASVFDSIFGGNSGKVAKSSPPPDYSSESRIVREDRLQAKLAISKQEGVPQPKPEPKLVVEQPKQAVEPSIPKDTVQTEPEVEPGVEEKVEVDPLEEWARLANLGVDVGNSETAIANLSNNTNTVASTPAPVSTPAPTSTPISTPTPTSIPVANNNNVEDNLHRAPYPFVNKQEPTDDNQITEKEAVKIASVSIGKDIIETNPDENLSGDFSLDSPAVSKLLSDQESNNTYLEKKRKQFEEEDRLKQLSAMGASNSLELVSANSVFALNHRLTPADTGVQSNEESLPPVSSPDTELSNPDFNETNFQPTAASSGRRTRRMHSPLRTAQASKKLVSVSSVSDLNHRLSPADTGVQSSEELLPPVKSSKSDLTSTTLDTPTQDLIKQKSRSPAWTTSATQRESFRELEATSITSSFESQETSDQKTGTKQVPLGTIVPGEIASNIVWSEESDPTQSRGIINLTEPLLASDGSVALKANSSLIAEVKSIESSGLTYLNVIAVSYEDSTGKLKQETLPPGAILIRGEDSSALIAEQTTDPGGTVLGQDVLIGLLGAGEMGFKELNQPDENTTISGDNDLVIRTNNDDNSSLINGAAQGIFSTTKERLDERSDQIVEQELARVPIYQLKAGHEVTIFINSFLEIN